MKRNTLDIRAGLLFPFHFMIVGGGMLLVGLAVVVDHPAIATALILLSIFVLTAYEGTEIDAATKSVREYYSFFFLKTGKFRKCGGFDGIAIYRAKVSRKMFAPRSGNSSTFTYVVYNAYLKLAGGEKIFLFGGRNKTKVLHRARQAGGKLGLTVADHAVPV